MRPPQITRRKMFRLWDLLHSSHVASQLESPVRLRPAPSEDALAHQQVSSPVPQHCFAANTFDDEYGRLD